MRFVQRVFLLVSCHAFVALTALANSPPPAPIPFAPANGVTGLSPSSVTLSWYQPPDADGDLIQNNIVIGPVGTTGITYVTVYSPLATPQLLPNTTYHWQVIAIDFLAHSFPAVTYGPEQTFTTGSGASSLCLPNVLYSQSCTTSQGCPGTQTRTCNASGTGYSDWSACSPSNPATCSNAVLSPAQLTTPQNGASGLNTASISFSWQLTQPSDNAPLTVYLFWRRAGYPTWATYYAGQNATSLTAYSFEQNQSYDWFVQVQRNSPFASVDSAHYSFSTAGSAPPQICAPNSTQTESCSTLQGCVGNRSRVCNSTGSSWSAWSDCLASNPASCGQPSAPSLFSPPNNSPSVSPSSVNFFWTLTFPSDGSALQITFFLRRVGEPTWSNTALGLNVTNHFRSDLLPGQVYEWYVRAARTSNGTFADSQTFNFATSGVPPQQVCTPGTTTTQSCVNASGCAGTQSRICNAQGTGWSAWGDCLVTGTTGGVALDGFCSALDFPPLSFPLAGETPYTVAINAVFDHSMNGRFCPASNGEVTDFTGAKGVSDPTDGAVVDACESDLKYYMLYAMRRASNESQPFCVNGNYTGGGASPFYLQYQGHPGYDFRTKSALAPDGVVDVRAPADGVISRVSQDFGVVVIDHISGYQTVFIHLSQCGPAGKMRPIADCARDFSQGNFDRDVHRLQLIGKTGGTGRGGIQQYPAHLHFEVRRNLIPTDPYGWLGAYSDPYTRTENRYLWEYPQNKSICGAVAPGGVLEGTVRGKEWWVGSFSVAGGTASLLVTLDWPGMAQNPDLDLHLISPLGKHYGFPMPGLSPNDQGYNGYDRKPEQISVPAPTPGQWQVRVYGWTVGDYPAQFTVRIQ